jgi:hypothetical protein
MTARIIGEFYFFRDQRTRASAIRSHDRRRLIDAAVAAMLAHEAAMVAGPGAFVVV